MAKKPKKPEFEKGWRVIAYLAVPAPPGWFGTQRNLARVDGRVGIVGDTVMKRTKFGLESWVYINIEGKIFFVPEPDLEYKTDEPYWAEIVKELQQASLVRRMVTTPRGRVEREYITTPLNKRGYLKPLLTGSDWGRITRFRARLLDDTYKRLTAQAACTGGQ